ncbi:TetR/AcrR family transcriptional regulator [Jatrophihabitans sp.]|uniref:TetR/AcrR family transcriptional regulator n=1 Tax=Jatrophihabitans sp. TaxID=1932789 RepID=UPI002C1CCDD7|nr:TetR/AcrR family transcriptional regulator [Jatrophihabitans sp.]
MSGDTRERLLAGTIAALRDKGIAGTSARSIAAAAGVNQALVFYHFGSVDELIIAACQSATRERVALYADRFADVTSLRELLTIGQDLHEAERAAGNTRVLAQVLAAAQQNAILAEAAKQAFGLWITEIELTLRRILAGSPIKAALDIPGLARAIAAAFIGLELYEAADPDASRHAMAALGQLAILTDVLDDLGPVARRALAARLRRSQAARTGTTR